MHANDTKESNDTKVSNNTSNATFVNETMHSNDTLTPQIQSNSSLNESSHETVRSVRYGNIKKANDLPSILPFGNDWKPKPIEIVDPFLNSVIQENIYMDPESKWTGEHLFWGTSLFGIIDLVPIPQ